MHKNISIKIPTPILYPKMCSDNLVSLVDIFNELRRCRWRRHRKGSWCSL